MKHLWKIIVIAVLVFAGVWVYGWYTGRVAPSVADSDTPTTQATEGSQEATVAGDVMEAVETKEEVNTTNTGVVSTTEVANSIAYVAGGCFWCTENDYEKIPGVIDAVSGYMGGTVLAPSYNQVVEGGTGHREIVKVVYDSNKITYRRIVLELFRETDPTDAGGSFYDRGYQYTSAIYYQNDEERTIAEEVIKELEERKIFKKPIATSVEPAGTFWIAEKYHQDYANGNPLRYKYYRSGSGRDAFIESVWGDGKNDDLFEDEKMEEDEGTTSVNSWNNFIKPSKAELKETLTELQYYVTQKEGTEKPFQNEYWDNHEEGIYVDVVSGEPLFSSTDKFDSGTGWPSFLKPIEEGVVVERDDYRLIFRRTEIRSKIADSHLGHIIMDGPKENDYIRYCTNSASLRFVAKTDLLSQGYSKYTSLFTS